jgi:hypothetical protein
MVPEVALLSAIQINWPSFRSTMDKSLELRPESVINRLPIKLSDDAVFLLNLIAFHGLSISSPLLALKYSVPLVTDYLHYTFMIACEEIDIQFNNITIMRNGNIIIATGPLTAWYHFIVNNLNKNYKITNEERILVGKLLLILERERGLGVLFEKHRKKLQPDGTFLLE